MRKPPEVYAPPDVYEPPKMSKSQVLAIKALATGTANESQQKRALEWIVKDAANANDLAYRGMNTHDTSFALGRGFLGLQIIKVVEMTGKSVESLNG